MNHSIYYSDPSLHTVFDRVGESARLTDQEAVWPAEQLKAVQTSSISRWGIPEILGGEDAGREQTARFYLDCSAACLTTSFVMSQRNAAVSRLVASGNEDAKQLILPGLASGAEFATVGLSHLSTSRQHLATPAVSAVAEADGYRLSGNIPWVTGATYADWLVTGGVTEDGLQVLVALDARQDELSFGEPAPLMALNGSATGSVSIENLYIPRERVIASPRPNVMKTGGGGTGSLTTSTLALGVAGRAVRGLMQEAEKREQLQPESDQLAAEWKQTVDQLLAAEANPAPPELSLTQTIRARANSLVLRTAQAYLTACKGAGFVAGHPAERTVRESMFFLVWSCPQPVAQAAMKEFACTPNWG
ncbi:acyl-CoA dehydrogenase family protein [Rubinisphaera sp. JC750]|uniref:acyl-CoA dehydrogenase family protein n=1 Tax=Rubinisphaera sp. JC750 TaxID=2898658 RepID=UPI001F45316E|nr:acyl-CoA dehydrogenase family protein [Rubinisphaera sp. JC750]